MKILFAGTNLVLENALLRHGFKVARMEDNLRKQADEQISLIVLDVHSVENPEEVFQKLHADFKFHTLRIVVICDASEKVLQRKEEAKISYIRTQDIDEIINQIDNIMSKDVENHIQPNLDGLQFKLKRAFDITVSGFALLLLSPVFLAIAVAIKLDSKGPVFFISKRVGTGYRVFDLYKFRTMKVGADKEIANMKDFNMYDQKKEKQGTAGIMFNDDNILIDDTGFITNEQLQSEQENSAVFMKFQNDPRITKLGAFLRNSSLDELPQLINIFKGDMSIVGNRPLPLYEAEMLTTDDWAMRFLAPAGLTGLWQVTKRGKGDMSKEERIQLDNMYAMDFSFFNDIKLMLKTIPAMLQKENV